jgi:hypothetical protein
MGVHAKVISDHCHDRHMYHRRPVMDSQRPELSQLSTRWRQRGRAVRGWAPACASLALLLLLALCACTFPKTSAEAATVTVTPAKKNKSACPDARQCNLMTRSATDALNTRVDDIFRQLYSVVNYVDGIVTIGDGGSVLDDCQVTSEDAEFGTACGRVATPGALPSYAYLEVTCPQGYQATLERDCMATAYDQIGERIGFRALLKSGSDGGVSYCHADTQDMAPGSQVQLEMTVRCAYGLGPPDEE